MDNDANTEYINEHNIKFTRTLEQFYGEHTTEIRQKLERDTAV
jgi:pre-mRNA-splicing factor SYF2